MKIRMSVDRKDTEQFIKNVIEKYHLKSESKKAVSAVYNKIKECIKPYALYKMNQRDTGIKDIDSRQSAIVAMTLGDGVDRLRDDFIRAGKVEEAYILECVTGEMLLAMYADFNKEYARFHRRYIEKYVFIGDEIPVSVIPKLLKEVNCPKTSIAVCEEQNALNSDDMNEQENTACEDEITADEQGVLMPSKSVVFYAILTDNPNKVCDDISEYHNNINY